MSEKNSGPEVCLNHKQPTDVVKHRKVHFPQ